MPAVLDDPRGPTLHRCSGSAPYCPIEGDEIAALIVPRQVLLRDKVTTATLLPITHVAQVPDRLMACLTQQMNQEIERGDTYPMLTTFTDHEFGHYWFQNLGVIMLAGTFPDVQNLALLDAHDTDWSRLCLGSFYIRPNYPGRSSHVCNAGFLVCDAARNRGIGRLMGECYLQWAPRLGYTYSVFNLVYETNVASCRIWDSLGFKKIGRVPGCGRLRSHPDREIDAIIYGRELSLESGLEEGDDAQIAANRFEKIRYYLKHNQYPPGVDRAEKSRLRSAASHYRLLPPLPPSMGGPTSQDDQDSSIALRSAAQERLMLKDKEVISDPDRQLEITRQTHALGHGGINKTTARISERYHWLRIKETVSQVLHACDACKDTFNKEPHHAKVTEVENRDANAMIQDIRTDTAIECDQ